MEKAKFPLFFNLEGKQVLVVGAGTVGMRRAGILAQFGAKVHVVAPEGGRETDASIERSYRGFLPSDLEGCFLVIAATNNGTLNDRIVQMGRERGILANHAGDQNQCDFFFPAVIRQDNLVIGVTSSGEDHALVRRIAGKLRAWIKSQK